jgi:hypothetical protein
MYIDIESQLAYLQIDYDLEEGEPEVTSAYSPRPDELPDLPRAAYPSRIRVRVPARVRTLVPGLSLSFTN